MHSPLRLAAPKAVHLLSECVVSAPGLPAKVPQISLQLLKL